MALLRKSSITVTFRTESYNLAFTLTRRRPVNSRAPHFLAHQTENMQGAKGAPAGETLHGTRRR